MGLQTGLTALTIHKHPQSGLEMEVSLQTYCNANHYISFFTMMLDATDSEAAAKRVKD